MNSSIYFKDIQIQSQPGELVKHVTHNWLIGIRESNPAIIDMFRERDSLPYRDTLPWSGEFAGKYLVGAYSIYRLTKDAELLDYIKGFIEELITCISMDGYIGCYQSKCMLSGAYSQSPDAPGSTWDAWSHYYIMYGLYLWSSIYNKELLLSTVRNIASLFMSTFYEKNKSMLDMGSPDMNMAPIHIFALLYSETGRQEYLDFANFMLKDIGALQEGCFFSCVKDNTDFYCFPSPRWESLQTVRGIGCMYMCTGNVLYKDILLHIYKSIVKSDIHNTGAFSTNEQAVGTPYINETIDLCSVITFNELSIDCYRLSSDPSIIDLLELSYFNSILGSFSPSGKWCTYSTPMEGQRISSCQAQAFQSRPGSPELNSCSSLCALGLGQLSSWMVTDDGEVIYINYYGPFKASTDTLSIEVSPGYIDNGRFNIHISSPVRHCFAFRIPSYVSKAFICAGGTVHEIAGGRYFKLLIQDDFDIHFDFDFSIRTVKGGLSYASRSSIYYGPILLGADVSGNIGLNIDKLPHIYEDELKTAVPQTDRSGKTTVKLGSRLTLCDFAHLGMSGCVYRTWFNIKKRKEAQK